MYEGNNISEIVRKAINDYVYITTTLGKYVKWSMYLTVEQIDAYLNSKHTTGEEDSLGRDKPFFNIVTAATNIWYRATDIDRKDIRIKATKTSDYLAAFLATVHLQEWMRKVAFGKILNEWGRSLARYGSSVLKFVEKDGELIPNVIPWNRLVVDPVDFENNPKIEKLYFTPSQLRKNKAYDQDVVKQLLESTVVRKTLNNERKDIKDDYIEVYEVHGEFPLSYITEDEKDEETFVQQMHVVSFIGKKVKGKNVYEDFTLFKGKEEKDPYMITHLIKEDGRTLAIGAVEHLFNAQWMVNHTAKAIKDQLDLASKLIFQTADTNFVGRNVLTNIENGDIMIHTNNQPLTQLQNNSHDISALESYQNQWVNLSKDVTSTPDALRGNTMPSGTAYRQVALLSQQSNSLFELMTENKGLAIEDMLRNFIIPFIKKQLNHGDEIAATLQAHQITQIDSMYIPAEATRRTNEKIKQAVLKGDTSVLSPFFQKQQTDSNIQDLKQQFAGMGNQRFIKPSDVKSVTWKSMLKDLEWEVECEVTGEETDKQATLQTLNTVLQTVASNPAILQDPNAKLIFSKILETAGNISPLEISQAQAPQPQGPAPKVSESINFKDLPPDGKQQMAKQAGININPSAQNAMVGGTLPAKQ